MQLKILGFRSLPTALLVTLPLVLGADIDEAAADQKEEPTIALYLLPEGPGEPGDGKGISGEADLNRKRPARAEQSSATTGPERVVASPERIGSGAPPTNWWSWTGPSPLRHSPLQTLTTAVDPTVKLPADGERPFVPGPCCRMGPALVPDSLSNWI